MQLETFVEDALKTESQIEKISVNETLFNEVREILINAGPPARPNKKERILQ